MVKTENWTVYSLTLNYTFSIRCSSQNQKADIGSDPDSSCQLLVGWKLLVISGDTCSYSNQTIETVLVLIKVTHKFHPIMQNLEKCNLESRLCQILLVCTLLEKINNSFFILLMKPLEKAMLMSTNYFLILEESPIHWPKLQKSKTHIHCPMHDLSTHVIPKKNLFCIIFNWCHQGHKG